MILRFLIGVHLSAICLPFFIIAVVQLLSHVQFIVTPWITAHKAPLPLTISLSLLKFMPIQSVMLSKSSYLLPLPSPFACSLSEHQCLFQRVGSSHQWPKYWSFTFSNVLLMNIQGWFPLGLIGLILQSKWLSRVFSGTRIVHLKVLGSCTTEA